MRQSTIFYIILFLHFSVAIFTQTTLPNVNPIEVNLPDSTIFQSHLDSIYKYLYSDFNIVGKHLEQCKTIISKESAIPFIMKRDFIYHNVLHERNLRNYVKAYQILNDNRSILFSEEVNISAINQTRLAEGYILYNLGDVEQAQKIYLDLIEWSQDNNNRYIYLSGLYYLAQIQSSVKNYSDAEKNFLKVYELEQEDSILLDEHLTTLYELSSLYLNLNNYKKADEFNNLGLAMAKELKNSVFIFEFQNFMALIAIKKEQFASANQFINKNQPLSEKLVVVRYLETQLLTRVAFELAQNNNEKALKNIEHLIEIDSKEYPPHTIHLYESIHDLYNKKGSYQKAYEYLVRSKSIQDSVYNQKKIQQINFLNAKFETEQKEKSNQLLAAQVLHEKAQINFLYALALLCLFVILGLFGAYYQKQKYNHVLEQEIKKQTEELKNTNFRLFKSNEELAQFNRILSHDLKEPLRSIVSFSALAKRTLNSDHDAIEYIDFIDKGGRQLSKLIDAVSNFSEVDELDKKQLELTNLNALFASITNAVHSLKSVFSI